MRLTWETLRSEPYRVFFPLGLLAGIWGVMMWPLVYAGGLGFYPGEAHTRLMIEGFLGAFVAGFLGTAFPRLSGNKPWFGGEFGFLLLLWGLAVASHSRGQVAAGDAAFAGFLTVLFVGLVTRWFLGAGDTPPPGFVLVMGGIVGGAVSAGMLAKGGLSAPDWQAARLCLLQGFPLLPVMGIGPYVLPRFFGHPSGHSFDESPTPPKGWMKRAAASAAAGSLVVAGFFWESRGHAAAGQLLRAVTILGWFAIETPWLRTARKPTTPGNAIRWAFAGMVTGLVCAAFWPQARIGSLHLFFVAGLGLATLAVATRVVLGHAGRHDLLQKRIVWLRWVTGLLVLAALTRMTSDFIPKVTVSHHIYAAWSWAAGCMVWLIAVARYFFRREEDS